MGDKWRERAPLKDLEQVKRGLPIIMRTYAGKGIIDYATVLPAYIPMILEAYGAPLSTAQITSLIVGRISPPLFSNPTTPNPGDQQEHEAMDGFMVVIRGCPHRKTPLSRNNCNSPSWDSQ